MFSRNTLFVVGAGASAELDMPVGEMLTKDIAKLLDYWVEAGRLVKGDPAIYNTLQKVGRADERWAQNRFFYSGREMAEAMGIAPSIDTFLESHASNEEFVFLGKLGIVRAIAMAERSSTLNRTSFNIRDYANTWYYRLARQLFSGVPVETPEAAFDGVSFVDFNYDRCLPYFLTEALRVYFRISPQQASEIVQSVPIIHPYGDLGSVHQGTKGHVPFAPNSLNLIQAADNIKTYSESADSEIANQIAAVVEDAETFIFLGFGFHQQNVELLDINLHRSIRDGAWDVRAFATTYELSESDTAFVQDQIARMLTGGPYDESDGWISTHNGKCFDLFGAYWRSLTA